MDDLELVYDQAHELDPELHSYSLDPQLERDTLKLGSFPLCDLLLMNDANYPWFILVPRRADVSEIYHLTDADQLELIKESSTLSLNLVDIFSADKMNVAALGNVVHQLHLHHVVRFKQDAAWPSPVWGKIPSRAYTDDELAEISQRVVSLLVDRVKFEPL
ncbi:HIT domain-containing protein [Motiliproteus sp. MSK22-1]|uniref:HIT domain-containing protein n=1 Tax=Motiliproteus sp. MSK22-1 TaxID=1897630 RepID=UPI0009785383|nr:HIT domain-containing protein [Motiliproteus sp. MSK22-1]OMH33633.1 histidine triad (HIT) protein [Motiliproteus sp. MSK22-1]